MQRRNRLEHADGSLRAISKRMRAQLVTEYPSASPEEVEIMLARRIKKGMRPTTARLPLKENGSANEVGDISRSSLL